MLNLKLLTKNKQAKKIILVSFLNVLVTSALLYISHTTNSLALTAFAYLTVFDLLSLLSALLSIWIKFQVSSPSYPYGLKRCEVLAIFSTSILTILGALFITKECVESLFEEKEIHTGRILPAIIFGFIFHILLVLGVRNESFEYVIKSSPSSWLQEHMFDLSETTCRYIPSLTKTLLPRANPFVLIGFADFFTVIGAYCLLQMGSTYVIDSYAAILISFMTFGTMLPIALYTSKILLQTTPSHLITQLDKCLREASTLDGVLEFRDEHFWTLSFGVLAGSLHVRIRRDADEQLVLAHVWNKLAGIVQILTIHIFKDDWMRRTTHQLVYNQQSINFQFAAPASLPQFPKLTQSNQTQQQQQPKSQSQSEQSQQQQSNTATNQNNPNLFISQIAPSKNLLNQTNQSGSSPMLFNSATTRKSPTNSMIVDNDYVIVNP